MGQTFSDIYWEIRSSRGIGEAERYKAALQHEGHPMHKTVYDSRAAMDGAEDSRIRRHAAEAFDDLERREYDKEQEARLEYERQCCAEEQEQEESNPQ